ncbi:MAG: hypothetical protein IK149_03270 [Oscillospiraceae bacterium]|nr:hypothetical protein [Oscillospiraceae bacterium]
MAIIYVPGAAGWDDNGMFGAAAQLRMKLESSYDPSLNRSALTLTLQCRAPTLGGRFYLLDNALLRINGGTFFSGGGSGLSSLNVYADLSADENWHDLCDGTSGEALRWTLSLDHDAQGRAEAELDVTARLYRDQSYYLSFFGLNGTALFEETRQFTLTLSAGTGCSILVRRGGVSLASGAALNWGDVLSIVFLASEGYVLTTHTVNGENFIGGSYTVTGDVAVAASAASGHYPLTISAGQGTFVRVWRNGMEVHTGAALYDGDRLTVDFQTLPGYLLLTHTLNGVPHAENVIHIVSGPVSIAATARRVGLLRLDTGSAIVPCRILLDTGSAFVPARLFLDRGGGYTEV